MDTWPALSLDDWSATKDTLHLWTQIVGKVRLVQTPWVNHAWHVPLYVTAQGLTTGLVPHASGPFEVTFDFSTHRLVARTVTGDERTVPLEAQTVAAFYAQVMAALDALGVPVDIYTVPSELEEVIPFEDDQTHASYDPAAAQRFWQVLVQSALVFQRFRAEFIGKCSPVHFFWGSFDLAVTRFSGREAPLHPGGIPNMPDWVAQDAYSHEVSSVGFWPGGGPHPFPLYYSYAYPSPDGFADASVQPDAAFYSQALQEFVLPYEAVRTAADPAQALYDYMISTYAAAADLGHWDRAALERPHHPDPDHAR